MFQVKVKRKQTTKLNPGWLTLTTGDNDKLAELYIDWANWGDFMLPLAAKPWDNNPPLLLTSTAVGPLWKVIGLDGY